MSARRLIIAEENIHRLESALGAGFWRYDCRSDVLEWSLGFYSLFGLKPEAVMPDLDVGKGLIHPEDRQEWADILRLARTSRQTDQTIRIIRPDGHMTWVRSHFEGQFDRSGNLIALYGVLIDVSAREIERGEAEKDRALAASLRKLTHGTIWRAGPDGKLLDAGDWIRCTGETPEQARDWDTLAPIHPDDREEFRAAWQKGISQCVPISYQLRIRDRSGKYTSYQTRAIPVEDDAGQIIEWHGHSMPLADSMPFAAQRLTSAQIRAARALLDWSGPDLADHSGISFSTIKRMEKSEDLVKADSVKRVRATLEDAGIRFASGADGEIWVALAAKN